MFLFEDLLFLNDLLLFERSKGKQIIYMLVYAPLAGTELIRRQDPGASPWSPTRVQGPKDLSHTLLKSISKPYKELDQSREANTSTGIAYNTMSAPPLDF